MKKNNPHEVSKEDNKKILRTAKRIAGVNRYNYDAEKVKGEYMFGPSLTVPGQTESIQHMIKRMQIGEPVTYDNRLIWEKEDINIPFPRIQDLTDLEKITEEYDEINKRIEKAQETLKERREKSNKEFELWKKSQEEKNTSDTSENVDIT